MAELPHETLIRLLAEWDRIDYQRIKPDAFMKRIDELRAELPPIIHLFAFTHSSSRACEDGRRLSQELLTFLDQWLINRARLISALCSELYRARIYTSIVPYLVELNKHASCLWHNPPKVYPNRRPSDIVL